MNKLSLALAIGLSLSSISTYAAEAYLPIDTCEQLVDLVNQKQKGSYVITQDLQCSSSYPVNYGSLYATIEGGNHTVYNLTSELNNGLFGGLITGGIRNLTLESPLVNPKRPSSATFVLSSRLSRGRIENLTVNKPIALGASFESIFRSAKGHMSNVTFNGDGVEIAGRGILVEDSLNDSLIENLTLNNFAHFRKDEAMAGLLSPSISKSTITNAAFNNIEIKWTGRDPRYGFVAGQFRDSVKVNGVKLENISFPEYHQSVGLIGYDESFSSSTPSTYSNISHNLFNDNAGESNNTMKLFNTPEEGLESRVSEIHGVNEPIMPPAECAPFLTKDEFFGVPQA